MTRRKPRPLVGGDEGELRDDRLFIIACDDTHAPKQYFEFFRLHRVKIHVVPTVDGACSSEHVFQRLCDIDHAEHDERWLLLDTDHYVRRGHIRSFRNTLREARRHGVNVALSRPCFEIWLLLHHVAEANVADFHNAKQVLASLKLAVAAYDKTRLKREHYSEAGVIEACRRAFRLDESVIGGDIPATATTRVHKLWREILKAAPEHMLPQGLRELRAAEVWT